MTPEERKRLVQRILDMHDEASRTLRQSSDAFDKAIASGRDMWLALQEANRVQGEVIDVILAANRAAQALHNDDPGA